MAVKKIENLNKHQNPSTNTNPFDVENYLNANWDKVMDVVDNNADELATVIEDNTTNKQDISELKQKNTEQDKTIQDNTKSIEELQKENTELKAENERLNNDINAISVTEKAEGENIILNDTAEARFKKFGIGGNSWQATRSGKNIFDNTLENYGHYGEIATTISTGVRMTANQTITSSSNLFGVYVIMDLSNYVGKTVRMKATYKSNSTLNGRYIIGLCASDGTNRSPKANSSSSGQEISFIVPELATGQEYLGVWFYTNYSGSGISGDYVDYTDVIITIDNADMTYEPYGEMPSPNYKSDIQNVTGNANVTVCNKNIAKSYSYVSQENQYYPLVKVDYVAKKDTNYVISFDTENTGVEIYLNLVTPSKLTLISPSSPRTVMDGTRKSFVVKATEDVEASGISIVARYDATSTTGTGLISNLQMEENSAQTAHVEHQEQNFTFPLAEGQRLMKGDYLADDGIHHKRKQTSINSSLGNYNSSDNWYYISNSNFANLINPGNSLSNYFTYKPISYLTSNPNVSGVFSNTGTHFVFRVLEFTSATEYRNFFAENSVIIEHDIAEEEIESYTEEQQAVYNEIKKTAHSYGEQTHIFSTDETSLIFNVEARKDMNTLVTRIERLESEV